MCDADLCVGIRLRETSECFGILGFCTFLSLQLVCFQLSMDVSDETMSNLSKTPIASKLAIRLDEGTR